MFSPNKKYILQKRIKEGGSQILFTSVVFRMLFGGYKRSAMQKIYPSEKRTLVFGRIKIHALVFGASKLTTKFLKKNGKGGRGKTNCT